MGGFAHLHRYSVVGILFLGSLKKIREESRLAFVARRWPSQT